jgi:hypothetical protein
MARDTRVEPRAISMVVTRPVRTFASCSARAYQCAVAPPQLIMREFWLIELTATARMGIHRKPTTASASAPATGWARSLIAPPPPAGRGAAGRLLVRDSQLESSNGGRYRLIDGPLPR